MSGAARDILAVFDTLEPAEKQQVAVEILRRSAGADELPDNALDELTDELFRAYDAEEAGAGD